MQQKRNKESKLRRAISFGVELSASCSSAKHFN
jgi:hypothetical protein